MGVDPKAVPTKKLYNGDEIPCIGMGTFGSDRVGADEVSEAVYTGIKDGYRMIDCAACYGNEDKIGVEIEKVLQEGIVARKDLYIMSKVWNDMHGKGDVLVAAAKSLRDLRLDYLDMYFVHWPFPNYHPPGCDVSMRNPNAKPFTVEDFMTTWKQMERLVDMGLVRHIGMSNMTIPKLEAVLPLCRIKPFACEIELHPCFQQKELYQYLQAHDILPIGYMPMGSPQRPERDMCPEDVADLQTPVMKKIAEAHGVHPAIIAIKWAHQRGQVPIPFSVHEKNFVGNLEAVTKDPLTQQEMEEIATLEKGNRLVKGQVFLWKHAKDWHDLWDEDGVIVK